MCVESTSNAPSILLGCIGCESHDVVAMHRSMQAILLMIVNGRIVIYLLAFWRSFIMASTNVHTMKYIAVISIANECWK